MHKAFLGEFQGEKTCLVPLMVLLANLDDVDESPADYNLSP